MRTDLLPPNATALERALDAAAATRLGVVDAPVAAQLDPATCPIDLLPFLAWSLSVDIWDPNWPAAVKREAVATSIAFHRMKGTRLALETVLARHDRLLAVVEWFEATPRRPVHTFDVILPLVTIDGAAPDPTRSSAAFAEAVVADIARVKPLREHFYLVQALLLGAPVAPVTVARVAAFVRSDVTIAIDTDPIWARLLQTEDGEPFENEAGDYLEKA